ncbi:unannotated protein [freshwater metagenome]|uniref:Unannotated protein n=1 Tax=freshwater metagenome TaxID=449393 RepID=A0A6J6E3D7_9ZZZZ
MAHTAAGNDHRHRDAFARSGSWRSNSRYRTCMVSQCSCVSWQAHHWVVAGDSISDTWLCRWVRVARHVVIGSGCTWCALAVVVCSSTCVVVVSVCVLVCTRSIRRSRRRHLGSCAQSWCKSHRNFFQSVAACSATFNCSRSRSCCDGSTH